MSAKADDHVTITREFRLTNELGLHARPAAKFVATVNRFSCDIVVEREGRQANGRSILGLMLLAIGQGGALRIHAHGQDAPQAVAELQSLIESRFGEDDLLLDAGPTPRVACPASACR
jgi:phosphocarrier protein